MEAVGINFSPIRAFKDRGHVQVQRQYIHIYDHQMSQGSHEAKTAQQFTRPHTQVRRACRFLFQWQSRLRALLSVDGRAWVVFVVQKQQQQQEESTAGVHT